MPRYILKMERDGDVRYMEWSTIIDAPVTALMTIDDFTDYYRDAYGQDGLLGELPRRLHRVEQKGTSAHEHPSASSLMAGNRAGPDETELTEDEIWEKYLPDDVDSLEAIKRKIRDLSDWELQQAKAINDKVMFNEIAVALQELLDAESYRRIKDAGDLVVSLRELIKKARD